MYDNTYHGYWFWSLRNDIVFQAKTLIEEYSALNCSQEYEGPFLTTKEAYEYRSTHSRLHEHFIQFIKEIEGNYICVSIG